MEWNFTFCAPTISNRQMSSREISSSLSLSSQIIIITISNRQMSSGEIIISSSPSSLSYLRYWPRLPSFIICDHPLFQAAPFDRPRCCQAPQLPRYWACAFSSSHDYHGQYHHQAHHHYYYHHHQQLLVVDSDFINLDTVEILHTTSCHAGLEERTVPCTRFHTLFPLQDVSINTDGLSLHSDFFFISLAKKWWNYDYYETGIS